MKKLMIGLIVVTLGLITTGVAFSGVPCAGTSTVEATPICGAYCPRGDLGTITVTVTVRDCYGTPLEGVEVEITPAAGTTGRNWCPGASVVVDTTDANGVATAQFKKFGGCGPAGCGIQFVANAEGVLLGPSQPVVAASPDNNADRSVTLADFIAFSFQYGSANCCSNFDCAGSVALSDFITFSFHYGHTCP